MRDVSIAGAGRRQVVTEPRLSYLVCSTPRSGSTLLCEVLRATGVAGRPEEYYQQRKLTGLPRRPLEYFEGAETEEIVEILGDATRVDDEESDYDARRFPDYAAYLDWTFTQATTANRVFGAKLMWGYFNGFVSNLRGLPGRASLSSPELLASVFPNLRYVAVTRADKIGQAISLWKALQTWEWNSADEGVPIAGELRYSFDAIHHLVRRLRFEEDSWRGFFAECGIEPYPVAYERLSADYEGVVGEILEFLDIPFRGDLHRAPRIGRQADEVSDAWRARYLAASHREEPR